MLGIRRYQGVAIDLWQGDIGLFVCDAKAQASAAALGKVDAQGWRHVAIVVTTEDPTEALDTVKAYLTGPRPGHGFKRISFVLANGGMYTAFQDALFALFPEDDL